MQPIEKTLDQLQECIAANPTRAFFNAPAEEAAITLVERTISLALPRSYRSFLRRFDGGFINISRIGPDHRYWSVKSARWNSNWLFGTAELVAAYNSARSIGGWEKISYVPFCQTSGQESLVFMPNADGSEPPVLDAWHEASEWKAVYPDFPAMLLDYIRREGDIETVARS